MNLGSHFVIPWRSITRRSKWSILMHTMYSSKRRGYPRKIFESFNSYFTTITHRDTHLPTAANLRNHMLSPILFNRERIGMALDPAKPAHRWCPLPYSASGIHIWHLYLWICWPPPCKVGYVPFIGEPKPLFPSKMAIVWFPKPMFNKPLNQCGQIHSGSCQLPTNWILTNNNLIGETLGGLPNYKSCALCHVDFK